MIKVNAIGEVCPKPVIMTKKALKEIESGVVEVSVKLVLITKLQKKMLKKWQKKWDTLLKQKKREMFL